MDRSDSFESLDLDHQLTFYKQIDPISYVAQLRSVVDDSNWNFCLNLDTWLPSLVGGQAL